VSAGTIDVDRVMASTFAQAGGAKAAAR
jgi:hypothetical protein